MQDIPASPNRMDAQGRKDLLVQATLRCLKKYGYQGTSVRKICAEADVSVGLINHHYASKDDLVAKTYEHLNTLTNQRLQDALSQAPDNPRAKLTAFFRASFGQNLLDPTLIEAWIVFWGAVRSTPAMHAVHEASYAQYRATLQRWLGALAQELHWQDFDAPLAAIALTALLDGLWLESGLSPDTFSAAQCVQISEAWVQGVMGGAWRCYTIRA